LLKRVAYTQRTQIQNQPMDHNLTRRNKHRTDSDTRDWKFSQRCLLWLGNSRI